MTLVSLDLETNATGTVKKPLYVHCKLKQTNWNTVNLIVLLLAVFVEFKRQPGMLYVLQQHVTQMTDAQLEAS